MPMLRIGTPGGEVVIKGATTEERRQLFDLIASFDWMVEERLAEDRVGEGWIGTPIRRANVPE